MQALHLGVQEFGQQRQGDGPGAVADGLLQQNQRPADPPLAIVAEQVADGGTSLVLLHLRQ